MKSGSRMVNVNNGGLSLQIEPDRDFTQDDLTCFTLVGRSKAAVPNGRVPGGTKLVSVRFDTSSTTTFSNQPDTLSCFYSRQMSHSSILTTDIAWKWHTRVGTVRSTVTKDARWWKECMLYYTPTNLCPLSPREDSRLE